MNKLVDEIFGENKPAHHERFRGEYPVRVRGLVNRFGEQTVHDGLDLDLKRGEILGVVGGSGTGKSVLMRSIIGLQQPDAGQIEVFGQSMTDAEPDEALGVRNRWGVLFQGGALFSTLTVGENVEVPLKQFYPEIEPELRHEIARYKVVLAGLPEDATSTHELRIRADRALYDAKGAGKRTCKRYHKPSQKPSPTIDKRAGRLRQVYS